MALLRALRRGNIRLRGFVFFICFSLFLAFGAVLNSQSLNERSSSFAYVFLVRNPKELCYALANSQRVLASMPALSVLLVPAYKVQMDKVVLPARVSIHATPDVNDGYHEAFLRFEAFGLTSYNRVIVMNSNLIATPTLNKLFWLELGDHGVAATLATDPREHFHLSTAIVVAEPSQELYERISMYQNPSEVQAVATEAGLPEADGSTKLKTLYEDALLNKMFGDGKNAKPLPQYFDVLGLQPQEVERRKEEMNVYCYIYSNAPD